MAAVKFTLETRTAAVVPRPCLCRDCPIIVASDAGRSATVVSLRGASSWSRGVDARAGEGAHAVAVCHPRLGPRDAPGPVPGTAANPLRGASFRKTARLVGRDRRNTPFEVL